MPELNEDVAAMLAEREAEGVPDTADLSVAGAREVHHDLSAVPEDERASVARVRDLEIGGPEGPVPLRVYEPDADGPRPVLVYLHGGGWVFGPSDAQDDWCRVVATAAGATVVAVDYRLAPEHTFPAPVRDCYAATEWAAAHPGVLDGDPERLVVGGDSAGGNLAAAVCLLARERDGPDIAHHLPIYPVAERDFETDSYVENAAGYGLTRDDMRWFWERYLADPLDAANPYAAPLRARDLSDLPPATVVTAGFDPLRDEGRAYASRLDDAGVPVEHVEYEGMNHGFATSLRDPDLDAARDVVDRTAAVLRSP